MSTKAERIFHQGLAALAESRDETAAECFYQALETEAQRGFETPDLRYLSYYGLSLARAHHALPLAIEACERAAAIDPARPVLLLNLGRVYSLAGRTSDALRCFDRAKRIAPTYAPLERELGRIDRRSRPLIPLLNRSHPVNRLAGRLRNALDRL